MVVENHKDTRWVLKMYLEYLGHTVTTAATKEEAVRHATEGDCDVLISDIALADGDGGQLLEQACFPKPPFAIAMSGYAMLTDRQKSALARYRRHMQKPFDLVVLDEFLAEAARELTARESEHCMQ